MTAEIHDQPAGRHRGWRRRLAPWLGAGAVVLAIAIAGCGGQASTASKPMSGGAKPAPMQAAKPAAKPAPKPAAKPAAPAAAAPSASGIPQNNGGDHDSDNNGGPSDGDGNI
jgi:hypothetical protein